MANCPHCKKFVAVFNVKKVEFIRDFSLRRRGLEYSCPLCHIVVSLETDRDIILEETHEKIEKIHSILKKLRI